MACGARAARCARLAPEGPYPFAREMYSPVRERSEEHTSELQSQSNLVCRLLLEKKKKPHRRHHRILASDRQPSAARHVGERDAVPSKLLLGLPHLVCDDAHDGSGGPERTVCCVT